MAYVEMTKDFSVMKRNVPGTTFTKRQIFAGIYALVVGIPLFVACYMKAKIGFSSTIFIMAAFIVPGAFLIMYEKYGMGIEKWGKIIYEASFMRNTHRPYKTTNLYEQLEINAKVSKEIERILYRGMSKKEIADLKASGDTTEIKLNGRKIKVPMRGKISLKTKRELERAVNKAKLKGEIPESAQDSIPYNKPYEDGVFESADGYYTKTIMFDDITYQLLDNKPKDVLFERWCKLINYFDKDIHFQFNYGKMEFDKDIFVSEFKLKKQNDANDDLREEYSSVLTNQFAKSTNSFKKERYLTYGIHANDLKSARLKMNKIDKAILKYLSRMDCKAKILNGYERLELLFRIFHPATKNKLFWNFDMPIKTGLSSKDFIAPSAFSFKSTREFNANKYFMMGDRIGTVHYLMVKANEMEDRIISDILDLDSNVWISIHNYATVRSEALKYAKDNINSVQDKIIREQRTAAGMGTDIDLLPPELGMYKEAADTLYRNLQRKDENLFYTTITIVQTAKTRKELENNVFELKGILQNYECDLDLLTFQQEQGFFSSLPLGNNMIDVKRTFTTNDLGIFIPFTTKELFTFNGQYYGLNSLSNNVIMCDRKKLVNPNGLVFGKPGYGKSFFIKREILDVFLKTKDDIIILDPEGEYGDLVRLLGGLCLDISLTSDTYINGMDIDLSIKNFDKDLDFKPIFSKCSFMVSLCDLILGGKAGLNEQEKSCIDRACQIIYSRYANNPTSENEPILGLLYNELVNMQAPFEELGKYLAVSLDRYVSGSLSYFNHKSTFKLNNRIICFNLKDMDKEQLDAAMFIIQEHIWSKVAKNRELDIYTRVYMDEFHVFLRNPSTAEYSVDVWKRFRKWFGIPTGMTQNVKDLFRSAQIQNILDVTNFIVLLEQAGDDEKLLADHLNLSQDECSYLHTGDAGKGLLCIQNYKLPFEDEYPQNTMTYKVMTTKPDEVSEYNELREFIKNRYNNTVRVKEERNNAV